MEKINIPQGEKFIIQIHLNGFRNSGSKAFLTEDSFLQVLDVLQKHISDFECGTTKLILKIIHPDTKTVRNITANIKVKNPKKIIEDIKLKADDFNICPTREKYRVVISNLQTKTFDKRGFSLRFCGTISECKIALQELLEIIIKENTDDDIVFETYQKKGHFTHNVVVQKSGTTKDYKKFNSKSFGIKFKNYSSEEIINLIRVKLKNGKK